MSAFVPRTKSPSRRKSSKSPSPDTSPKYKVGDEFFTKYYSFNIRIKDIDSKSREYVFEKAYDKDIKTVDERRILGNKDLKLNFNEVDDFPKVFVSMQGRSSSDKGGRKTNRKKSVKKNKTGKKLKRSGKKLIRGGGPTPDMKYTDKKEVFNRFLSENKFEATVERDKNIQINIVDDPYTYVSDGRNYYAIESIDAVNYNKLNDDVKILFVAIFNEYLYCPELISVSEDKKLKKKTELEKTKEEMKTFFEKHVMEIDLKVKTEFEEVIKNIESAIKLFDESETNVELKDLKTKLDKFDKNTIF